MNEPPPAGWYDATDAPGAVRFWDGTQWTQFRCYPEGKHLPAKAPPGFYPAPNGASYYLQWLGRGWSEKRLEGDVPAPPKKAMEVATAANAEWRTPIVPDGDLAGVQQRIEERHRERIRRWQSAVAPRIAHEQSRQATINQALTAVLNATTPTQIAATGGLFSRATLYTDAIEYKGTKYPLSAGVRAEVGETGNTSTAQGWVVKTQHDTRETYITIQGPDWHLDIRGAKGKTSSTDLSAAMENFNYRHAAKQARDFASAINNAARQVDGWRQQQRPTIVRAAEIANSAYQDTAAIEQAVETARAIADEQRPSAQGDLDVLNQIKEESRLTRAGRSLRGLKQALHSELQEYQVAPFSPGNPPDISVPPELPVAEPPSATVAGVGEPLPSSNSEGPDVLEQIKKLGELREAGLLTETEFESKKTELLSRL